MWTRSIKVQVETSGLLLGEKPEEWYKITLAKEWASAELWCCSDSGIMVGRVIIHNLGQWCQDKIISSCSFTAGIYYLTSFTEKREVIR